MASKEHVDNNQSGNGLLQALSAETRIWINARLSPMDLPIGTKLETPGKEVPLVYFFLSGMGSVIAPAVGDRDRVEVGIVGCEGVSGHSLILGGATASHEVTIQATSTAQAMRSLDFAEAQDRFPDLSLLLRRFMHSFLFQVSDTVRANARAKIIQRLARWLLLMQDRVQADELQLTHKYLAIMLGVQRSGVTNATHILEGLQLIRAKRNSIRILDRDGLIQQAAGYYGATMDAHRRFMAGE